MKLIQFENVSKFFGSTRVISDVNMDIVQGETLVLLGPSGSGKTTILKLINGLEKPGTGRILYKGEEPGKIHPHQLRRNIGYVIQDAGLFPHLTVKENITIPIKISGNKVKAGLVENLLKLVGIEDELTTRYPHELSGGQQQRVGIARALANEPEMILMDEPFSALDNITRKQLQDDFLKLDYLTGKTVVIVTHDIFEAFKLGDRVVILNEGKVQQIDSPFRLLFHPANSFVSNFLKKDQLLLKLQNLSARQIGFEKDQTLFQILDDPSSSGEEKLQVVRNFFDFENQQNR